MNDEDRADIDGVFGPKAKADTIFGKASRDREAPYIGDGTNSERGNDGSSVKR